MRSGYGRKGGTSYIAGKVARKFKATFEGREFSKRVFVPVIGKPIALFYHGSDGTAYLNTVVGSDNMPEWADRNYIKVEAVEVL